MKRFRTVALCGVVAAALAAAGTGCGSTYAVRHTVQKGDTVRAVAGRYGVSEAELRRFNELEAGDQLRRGDVIFIPGVRTDRGRATPPATGGKERVAVAGARPPAPPSPVSAPRRKVSSGELAWPVGGKVLRGFGSGPAGDSRGIDIAASAGALVSAAEAGTVTYAGVPAPAYGTIVIVEHRGRLFTVYSGLASASVTKGARVEQGQPLGNVAAGQQSHVHFEVRRDETAVDPLLFLPPR